jgi:hypothetical protein
MSESNEKPEKKRTHEKPWYKRSAILAVGAMIISIASAGVSGYLASQANEVAEQQKVVAEQQELVTLIANIAQEPATIAQESATFYNNAAALHNAEVGTQLTELADSEEAAYLIGLLHHDGVTAVEYYYAAVGLQAGESDAQALSLLESAATLPADPRTHANILRAEAEILYQFGKDSEAEHYIMLAEQAYKVPGVTSAEYTYNLAYTELFDAQYQARISCSKAQGEVTNAATILKKNPGIDTPIMTSQEMTDEGLVKLTAPSSGSVGAATVPAAGTAAPGSNPGGMSSNAQAGSASASAGGGSCG